METEQPAIYFGSDQWARDLQDQEMWAYSHEHRMILDRVVWEGDRLVTQITRETEGEMRSRGRAHGVYYPDCQFMPWRDVWRYRNIPR